MFVFEWFIGFIEYLFFNNFFLYGLMLKLCPLRGDVHLKLLIVTEHIQFVADHIMMFLPRLGAIVPVVSERKVEM